MWGRSCMRGGIAMQRALKMKGIWWLGSLLSIVFLSLFSVQSVSAKETIINESQSLQKAIDQADSGDVLKLTEGVYSGALLISKPLTIMGTEGVIIDGENVENVITIQSNNVTIKDIEIQNGAQSGVYVKESESITIEGTTLQNVMHGIHIEGGSDYQISENTISSVVGGFSEKGHGMYLAGGTNYKIENNTIYSVLDGIYSEKVDTLYVNENTITFSRYAVHLMFNKDALVENNHLEGNITGIMCMDSQGIELIGNTIVDHFNVRGFGLIIYDSSEIEIVKNEVRLNSTGLSLEKTVNVQIEKNVISGNQVGLEFIGSNENNIFTENNFIGNVVQSKITNNQMQLDNGMKGNYWDDYKSYDVTGDGIGEITYKAGSLYDQLLEKQPYWQFFFESPSIQLWSKAETLFPSIGLADVYDENPLVEPVVFSKEDSEDKERNIGALIVAIPFLWFSILLMWLGRRIS